MGVAAQAGEQTVLKACEHHQQDRRLVQLRYRFSTTMGTDHCSLLLAAIFTPLLMTFTPRCLFAVLPLFTRLLKSENDPGIWLTEDEILTLVQHDMPFKDVTDHRPTVGADQLIVTDSKYIKYMIHLDREGFTSWTILLEVPDEISYGEEVQRFIGDLDTTTMEKILERFTRFHTRYYKSPWGREASTWLFGKINEIAKPANDRVTVEQFKHPVVDDAMSIHLSIPNICFIVGSILHYCSIQGNQP